MKKLIFFCLSLALPATVSAHAIQFGGEAGSVAALISEGLLTRGLESPESGVQVVLDNGSLQASIEDGTHFVVCAKSGASSHCHFAEKHGRPLADLSTYPLGDYMDLKGGEASIAGLLNGILESSDQASSSDITESVRRSSLEIGDVKLACLRRSGGENGLQFECGFKLKKK